LTGLVTVVTASVVRAPMEAKPKLHGTLTGASAGVSAIAHGFADVGDVLRVSGIDRL
jgi:hypothetical protein